MTAPDEARRYVASTGDAVRPAAFGLAVAYLVVALPPALLLPASQRAYIAPAMLLGAAACSAIGWAASLVHRDPGDVVHWWIAGLAGVPTATSLTTLMVMGQPFETVNFMLTLVGATALIHVRRAAVAVGVVVVAGWLLAGLLAVPAVITADTLSEMGMACAVAVILHVSRQRTVARLDAAREQIAAMAVTDVLTGLGNRRAVMDRGPTVLAAARRERRDVTLLYLDVDGLKGINDRHGHAAGDRLIASVGAVLRAVFRDADIIARSGGDEFAVLLAGCGPGDAAALTARLTEALALVGASASVGVAHVTADQPDGDLETLLEAADSAMYRDKHIRREANDHGGSGVRGVK